MTGLGAVHKIPLEDALDATPQFNSLVNVFEADVEVLSEFATECESQLSDVIETQQVLCQQTASFARLLKTYGRLRFSFDASGAVVADTLNQFATIMEEVSSSQQVLCTQLLDMSLHPLNKFCSAELSEITSLKELKAEADEEYTDALLRYMKLSRKREQEKPHTEACLEVSDAKKRRHQVSLHYFSQLNLLQYKRIPLLLEPALQLVAASRLAASTSGEVLERADELLRNITTSLSGVKGDLSSETAHTVELVASLEEQAAHRYWPDATCPLPPGKSEARGQLAVIPPNSRLQQKSGWVLLRQKTSLITSRWDPCYLFTQLEPSHSLMHQQFNQLTGSELLPLDTTISGAVSDQDDRRNVFQLSDGKKTVHLQAENERERDEWLMTLANICKLSVAPAKVATKRTPSASSASLPAPAAHPATLSMDTPIQFDLTTPDQDMELPPLLLQRSNAFTPGGAAPTEGQPDEDGDTFANKFDTRFLGCIEVQTGAGEMNALLHDTIRQIVAARAIHDIFLAPDVSLIITSQALHLVDTGRNKLKVSFSLPSLLGWAAHRENGRLFACLVSASASPRSSCSEGGSGSSGGASCYVFECRTGAGEDIAAALQVASSISAAENLSPQDGGDSDPVKAVERHADATVATKKEEVGDD